MTKLIILKKNLYHLSLKKLFERSLEDWIFIFLYY